MPRNVKQILKDDAKKPAAPGSEDADELLNDDVLIEDDIVDEGGQGDKKKPSAEDEAAALREQLKKANERAEREAARAAEAEARAGSEAGKAKNAFEEQIKTREVQIDSNITSAKTKLDSIKQQLKIARANQDTDAEIDLQDAMTDARYELNTAEWEKKNFTAWKEEHKKIPVQANVGDPASPYTAKERAWIAKYPDFNSNKKFSRLAKLAAQEARDEGHAQDSPGYFNYIEDTLRESGLLSENGDPLSGAGDDVRTTTSTAAAPQRSGDTKAMPANAKYPNVPRGFRIPADWAEAAEAQGFEGKEGLLEYTNMRLEEEAKPQGQR